MGQIVKQVSNHSTRYYWYPGDKKEWLRGVTAIAAGGAVYALLHLLTHGTLLAAVVGTSVTAAMAGLNFGRRDSRELARFAELAKTKPVRRQTAVHTGRAVWRGVAEGTGGAAAAVIIVNLGQRGILADWLLPLVPAVVGALAHQIGGMYEHLGTSRSTEGPAKRAAVPASADAAPVTARAAVHVGHGRSLASGPATRHSARHAAVPTVSVSPLHVPVILPPNVVKVTRPKPLMPLSAAVAARKDVAEIAAALGTGLAASRHEIHGT
jgi:hypothetical protein